MAVENKVVCLASVFKSIADAKKILEELSEISNKRFDGSALPLSEIVDLPNFSANIRNASQLAD